MKKLFLAALAIAVVMMSASAQDQTLGMFVEALESAQSFDETNAALENGIAASGFELLGVWNTVVPDGADYRSKVYVVHDPAYTAEIGKFEGPHAPAAMLRINVYEFGPQKAVRVNFVNAEAIACVYLFENGISTEAFDSLLSMAATVNQNLKDLIVTNVDGVALNEQGGPIRALDELHPYIGDGDAQVMVNFSDYVANFEQGFVQAFGTLDEATGFVESQIANNTEGWELISTLDVGNNRLYGISKDNVEAVSAEIVGGALGAAADNPAPGINHNAAYPIEVLVYEEGGQFKVAFPAQMWRMMLYYWDAGIGAFVEYQTLPGEFDASLLAALGG